MADKLLTIRAEYDYIQGHLRYGHKELQVSEFEWNKMSPEEQREYFEDEGKTVVDDYSIEDKGDLGEMRIV